MKNNYEERGETTVIYIKSKTYGDLECLISTSDLERAKEMPGMWNVQLNKDINTFYVKGRVKDQNGNTKGVLLHRWLLGLTNSKFYVDHIFHNTLDNRRQAMRVCSNSENQQNMRMRNDNKSGRRGVSWSNHSQKWRAQIRVNGRYEHLGFYKDLTEAVSARKEAEKKYFKYLSNIQKNN